MARVNGWTVSKATSLTSERETRVQGAHRLVPFMFSQPEDRFSISIRAHGLAVRATDRGNYALQAMATSSARRKDPHNNLYRDYRHSVANENRNEPRSDSTRAVSTVYIPLSLSLGKGGGELVEVKLPVFLHRCQGCRLKQIFRDLAVLLRASFGSPFGMKLDS
jgi:hypothetical protein